MMHKHSGPDLTGTQNFTFINQSTDDPRVSPMDSLFDTNRFSTHRAANRRTGNCRVNNIIIIVIIII